MASTTVAAGFMLMAGSVAGNVGCEALTSTAVALMLISTAGGEVCAVQASTAVAVPIVSLAGSVVLGDRKGQTKACRGGVAGVAAATRIISATEEGQLVDAAAGSSLGEGWVVVCGVLMFGGVR